MIYFSRNFSSISEKSSSLCLRILDKKLTILNNINSTGIRVSHGTIKFLTNIQITNANNVQPSSQLVPESFSSRIPPRPSTAFRESPKRHNTRELLRWIRDRCSQLAPLVRFGGMTVHSNANMRGTSEILQALDSTFSRGPKIKRNI